MREMIVRLAVLFGFAVLLVAQSAKAQSAPQQGLEQLATATSLDREGLVPWHLKVSFELNDLDGKPKEQGTIEEWWSSPKSRRLLIVSPSYNATYPGDAPRIPDRESYLVNELLDQVVHPIRRYGSSAELNVDEHEQMFGKLELSCLYVSRKDGKASGTGSPMMYCVEPGSNVLRVSSDLHEPYVMRNQMARFENTSVALDDAIAFGSHIAITGKVDKLETYKPDTSLLPSVEAPVEGHDKGNGDTTVPGTMQAGKILQKVAPSYPEMAKMQHIGGTVLMGAVISKTGTISTLYVIASPDESLSAAAMDAVKQWRYEPYLLNGQPIEVDTIQTVNFNLNGR
jgi:TonB family protein